jgi:glycosyltransferase involved in cell wall biosynthesis
MKPKVSIVIPVYNGAKTIEQTLEACLEQDSSADREIIVVDDGSTDSTRDRIRPFPVKYIFQPNRGPASARNTGWRASIGEIICFTDSDCRPRSDWADLLVKGFDAEDVGAVGGSYDIENGEKLLASLIHEEIVERHRTMTEWVQCLGSYNLSVRRRILEELKGFDEHYRFASGEDNDLSYRIRKAGYRLRFLRKARVGHHHTDRLMKYLREQYRHGFWRMRLYRYHPEMMKGDDYSGWRDFLQPPVGILGMLAFPLMIVNPKHFLWMFLGLISINFILPFPLIYGILRRKREAKFLFLFPLISFRSIARGLGMVIGLFCFFPCPKRKGIGPQHGL